MFKIGIYDFSDCIVYGTYQVNQIDQYDEWTDANRKKHHVIFGTKIEGNMTMHFRNADDADRFVLSLKTQKHADGYYPLYVDVVNTGDVDKLIHAFISCKPIKEIKGSRSTFGEFDLTLEETA